MLLFTVVSVNANPVFLMGPCIADGQNVASTATAYRNYLTPGAGTTTIGRTTTCNLTLNNGSVSDKLSLMLTHEASSSPLSVVNIKYQWSNDASNWFYESVPTVSNATTTQYSGIANYQYVQGASTTDPITGSVSATSTTIMEISNPDRARYFRAFFTVPAGASNSALHAEVVPRKQKI